MSIFRPTIEYVDDDDIDEHPTPLRIALLLLFIGVIFAVRYFDIV